MTFITVSNGKDKDYHPNDVVMTPENVVKKIMSWLPIGKNKILYDPFFGEGVFYNNFPVGNLRYWSEITKGKDFFDFKEHVDWIISNPPYSKYTEVMKHSYELADNIVYLVPLSKVVSSMGRIKDMKKYGGIKKLWIIPAGKCGFPFGFPACVMWVEKGYNGAVEYEIVEDL